MDMIVCVKRVPHTQEVDLVIDPQKTDIKKDMLAHVMNEWDIYAIEEAIQLKERFGGTVTAVTLGTEDDEEVLRRCLAMGADRAVLIDSEDRSLDSYVISKILSSMIQRLEFDLVMTGVQADDDNSGAVGGMLSGHLGLPHAAVVTAVEPQEDEVKIRIELEGGIEEVSKVRLPALLTIQTGINEPRYVSIMGIRKAAKKELKVMTLKELDLTESDLSLRTRVEEVFLPSEKEGAQIIAGDPTSVAEEVIRILKEKGVSV
jgi:electron transfer flavoprotein beta subunit